MYEFRSSFKNICAPTLLVCLNSYVIPICCIWKSIEIYDLSYLVTIRDFLNGDYGGYDDEDEYDDDEEENVSGNERRMPVIHNMNAKDKRETDQIRAYLDTKNKKYGDIEASMRKMGKPDAMAYYNSLKTQESLEKPKRTIVISEAQMKKLFNIN